MPIDRSSASAAEDAIQTGLRILREGKLLGIYPEGTRSPDGRLYRGKTGVARMALETGAPVVPVAMIYSSREAAVRQEDPAGSRSASASRWTSPATTACPVTGSSSGRSPTRSCTRSWTLSGQEYVDVYGATVKKSMDATGASAPEVVAKLQPPPDEAADRAPTSLAG